MIEIVGWYGAVAIVIAYFLNSFGRISANSKLYQLLNLTGALGIVVVSAAKSAWQPAALNTVWAIIGIAALFRMIRGNSKVE